jgi:hypothetical protein
LRCRRRFVSFSETAFGVTNDVVWIFEMFARVGNATDVSHLANDIGVRVDRFQLRFG